MEIDEELKKKMVEYLNQLESGLKSAKDFSSEQVPLLVQEYLNWLFWSSIGMSIICVAIFTVIYMISRKCHSLLCPEREAAERFLLCVFGGLLLSIVSVFFVAGIHDAAKVKIAPRVVILEKVSDLIKETK